MTLDEFKTLVGLTFRNPEAAATALLGAGWPVSARWMGLMLAVTVSALLAWLSSQLFPLPQGTAEGSPILTLTSQPMMLAGMQLVAVLMAAGLLAGVGRMFGGHGTFEDALLLTVWIEVVLLLVQAVQIAATLILPGVAGILGILAIALFFWLTVQFAKALHGFTSGPKVFLGVIGTAFAVGFALSLLAASLGLMPQVPQ